MECMTAPQASIVNAAGKVTTQVVLYFGRGNPAVLLQLLSLLRFQYFCAVVYSIVNMFKSLLSACGRLLLCTNFSSYHISRCYRYSFMIVWAHALSYQTGQCIPGESVLKGVCLLTCFLILLSWMQAMSLLNDRYRVEMKTVLKPVSLLLVYIRTRGL